MTTTFDAMLSQVVEICRPGTHPEVFREWLRQEAVKACLTKGLFNTGMVNVTTCQPDSRGHLPTPDACIQVLDCAEGRLGEDEVDGMGFFTRNRLDFHPGEAGAVHLAAPRPYPDLVSVAWQGLATAEDGQPLLDILLAEGIVLRCQARMYRATLHPSMPPGPGWEKRQLAADCDRRAGNALDQFSATRSYDKMRHSAGRMLARRWGRGILTAAGGASRWI